MEEEKEVKRISKRIEKTLRAAGLLKDEMSVQIELLARGLLLYRKLSEKAISEELLIKEVSREGEVRYRANPIISMLQRQEDKVCNSLSVLGMNRKLRRKIEDKTGENAFDPLEKMMKLITND